jgi:hypothetical protein
MQTGRTGCGNPSHSLDRYRLPVSIFETRLAVKNASGHREDSKEKPTSKNGAIKLAVKLPNLLIY